METTNLKSQSVWISPLFVGMTYAFIIMGMSALLTSLILLLTSHDEATLPMYSYAIHALALLIGGFISGKRTGNRGWYHGGLLGVLYSLIIEMVGFLGFDQGVSEYTFLFVLAAFVVGALGGIVGVNSSSKG